MRQSHDWYRPSILALRCEQPNWIEVAVVAVFWWWDTHTCVYTTWFTLICLHSKLPFIREHPLPYLPFSLLHPLRISSPSKTNKIINRMNVRNCCERIFDEFANGMRVGIGRKWLNSVHTVQQVTHTFRQCKMLVVHKMRPRQSCRLSMGQ